MESKIVVIGAGYVGLSLAVGLSQYNEVILIDTDEEKINKIDNFISPVKDEYINKFFSEARNGSINLNLNAHNNSYDACRNADFIIVSVPSDFDEKTNSLDCSLIKSAVEHVLRVNKEATIVIKSTVPFGCTEEIRKEFNMKNILYCPEFSRESKSLYDILYPSRIIVGCNEEIKDKAKEYADLLLEVSEKDDVDVLFMGTSEAEAVKLFSNTYLALRVSYFNELDSFAESMNLNTKDIIKGVCLDPRIGDYYNNPSFGYGGYCLPKDSKQLLSSFKDVPHSLIKSIIESDNDRKDYIVKRVLEKVNSKENGTKTIGAYRLMMKASSDNTRNSSIKEIIKHLIQQGAHVIIYEPLYEDDESLLGCEIVKDLEEFKKRSSLIIANRYDECLDDVKDKVYTRDLFNRD